MRFVAEFEVEVTDPVQAAAYTLGWEQDSGGTVMMSGYQTPDDQVWEAVRQALFTRLDETSERAGFRVLGGSVLPRPLDGHGTLHPEVTLPPMPARQDDGEFADG